MGGITMLTKIFLTALALALTSTAAAAQCGAIPNTLTNGQNADATQVMTNFNHLRDCINNTPPPSSIDDTNRRNILLNSAFIAKLAGAYVRNVSTFADGYKGSDGVNAGLSTNYVVDTASGRVSPGVTGNTAYSNPGGMGDRTASVAITAGGGVSLAGGTANQLINGTYANEAWLTVASAGYIQFDFGSGNSRYIDEIKWYQNSVNDQGQWKLQGSNDGTNFTDVSGVFPSNPGSSATTTIPVTWITAVATYRYYRITKTGAGTTNGTPYVQEIEFKISSSVPTPANMTLVTTMQTADAAITKSRVLLEYNPVDSITLNTDLFVDVTCNNAVNWTTATLTAAGTTQGGLRLAEIADTTCSAGGASFAARIRTANNKRVQISRTMIAVQ
jgi:hypothetical protein